jgi:hypothetical protein
MKKKLLSLAMLSIAFGSVSAQTNDELMQYFNEQREVQEAIFNRNQARSSQSTIGSEFKDISTIAAASDEFIFFNKLTDNRANIGSNVEYLQNSQIGGFSINGENMELTIYDGGRIAPDHQEFKLIANSPTSRVSDLESGAQGISTHATSVAGFIAAGGFYNITSTNNDGSQVTYQQGTKGVLPKARISSAGFSTVNGLSVHQKITQFAKPISNHSYGSNVGWELIDDDSHATGYGLIYNTNTSPFISPSQTLYGAYYSTDYNYDLIASNNPTYTIVKAAGNEYGDGPNAYVLYNLNKYKSDGMPFAEGDIIPQDNCQYGAYCISMGSLAKNIIVVGSVDVSADPTFKFGSANSIVHSSYSSAGPRKDGAIKPDIVAVGTDVLAPTYSATRPTNAYTMGSGTSFASPKVTGVVGAITQLKRLLTGNTNFYFTSDQVRAILLHTTQEAGLYDGPDNKFGWGLVDAKKAAETVLAAHNDEIVFEKNNKVSGVNYEKVVKAIEGQELKVTVTWIDPAKINYSNAIIQLANDTSSKLVNDLDVRVIDTVTNEVHLPWKLDLANVTGAAIKGDNTVDNIEQILIKNPVVGRTYKVVVSNKGTLVNSSNAAANQSYSLLVTGATKNLGTEELAVTKSEVSVYPTIAKDIVNVKSTAKIQKVDVIDITGKLVSTTKADKVDVSSLSAGVYLVNITTEEGVTTKKIVKQ